MEGRGGRIQCLFAVREAVLPRSVAMPGTVVLLPLEDQPWHKPAWPQGLAPSLQAVPTL